MKEAVKIYYGDGKGKTAAALGYAVRNAGLGKRSTIIQFLKGGAVPKEAGVMERLEPEVRLFRFEKSDVPFKELSEKEQEEEALNIRNTLNFSKKVLSTGESDLVVLDEVLGLVDEGLATDEELIQVLEARNDATEVILTGWKLDEKLRTAADAIYRIDQEER
ncbi:MAG: cob(I)yrinic acid a,c-diamide adenosyltransferase [Lachnospiraceae bacterium]|jgi:cob(I)alamin adenosyltransferase|nr:cob(I)yrinic acid a,c-diamide adenosyltransferase [Lachnospiraceae bacterium]